MLEHYVTTNITVIVPTYMDYRVNTSSVNIAYAEIYYNFNMLNKVITSVGTRGNGTDLGQNIYGDYRGTYSNSSNICQYIQHMM